MNGTMKWEEGAPCVPKAKTIPLIGPDFKKEVKGAIIRLGISSFKLTLSNTYTAGLEHGSCFENTNIPISDPAILLQETNRGKNHGRIITFDFPETRTLDLDFVNDFAKDKKLIKEANATFWIFIEVPSRQSLTPYFL